MPAAAIPLRVPTSHLRRVVVLTAAAFVAAAVPAADTALGQGPLDALARLDRLDRRPAPLVPTWAPAVRGAADPVYEVCCARDPRGYGLRLQWPSRTRTRLLAAMFLDARTFPSVAAARREYGRSGYRASATRVRGRAAALLRRPGRATLAWREGGIVYTLGTGSVSRVPLPALRRTAERLEPLVGVWGGSRYDDDVGGLDRSLGATLALTTTTVSGMVEWSAPCTSAEGEPLAGRGGQTELLFAPRTSAGFRVTLRGDARWTGTLEGSFAGGGFTLTPAISGADTFRNVLGETRELRCDPGGAPVALRRLARR